MNGPLEKRTLRERMRARRGAVTVDESRAAGARAAALLDARLAGRIDSALLYAALPGEVDTAPVDALLRRRGAAVCYPRVAGAHRLTLHLAAPEGLAPGRHGIPEPPPDAPQVSPGGLDLAVVPGLAFDRAGHRLGFGGGFFDALLQGAPRAIRCGVCFPWQLLASVPSEPHDERVHLIVTDEIVEVTP